MLSACSYIFVGHCRLSFGVKDLSELSPMPQIGSNMARNLRRVQSTRPCGTNPSCRFHVYLMWIPRWKEKEQKSVCVHHTGRGTYGPWLPWVFSKLASVKGGSRTDRQNLLVEYLSFLLCGISCEGRERWQEEKWPEEPPPQPRTVSSGLFLALALFPLQKCQQLSLEQRVCIAASLPIAPQASATAVWRSSTHFQFRELQPPTGTSFQYPSVVTCLAPPGVF